MKSVYIIDLTLLVILSAALFTDLRKRTISNRIILAGVIAGFSLNFLINGPYGLLFSTQGFLLGIALLFLPFAAGGMGAGDVKLMGVIGGMKGMEFIFIAFLASALTGGLVSLFILIINRRLWLLFRNLVNVLKLFLFPGLKSNPLLWLNQNSPGFRIPYAPAIAVGTVFSYFYLIYR